MTERPAASRHVVMGEVLDLVAYERERDAFRARAMAVKDDRRVSVGEHLTFLLENHDTVHYQVQEMMRAERMVEEAAIQHELDTYNGLLPPEGGVAATLLIEYGMAEEREEHLPQLLTLNEHLWLEVDGRRVAATWDALQVGDVRISSVQYLQFRDVVRGSEDLAAIRAGPVRLVSDHPHLTAVATLTERQRAALADDLRG